VTSGEIRQIMADLEAEVSPLVMKLDRLRQQYRLALSKEFIAANGITKGDVEFSDGPGKPYFGHISSFVSWLRGNSNKNWAEWNTCIYRMSDLKADRMPEMPAFTSELPQSTPAPVSHE
jgi:hypothetical protein